MIFSSLFFMFYSREWMSLHTVFIVLVLFSFLVFCFIPESPKFLVQRKEYLQANLAYNFVCRFNNQPDKQLDPDWERFKEEKSKDKRLIRKRIQKATIAEKQKAV